MASHAAGEPSRLHWRALLRRTLLLLSVWLLVGPVLGILFVDSLNDIAVGGMPLGFWIAQQGAIYVFVVLIFLNALLADRAEGGVGAREPDAAPHGGPDAAPDPAAPPSGGAAPPPTGEG